MKKILIIAALVMITPMTAQAGWLGNAAMNAVSSSSETKKPTAQYQLDVTGTDVRIYEWQPKGNPDVRCVMVAGSENSSGVACYKVKVK